LLKRLNLMLVNYCRFSLCNKFSNSHNPPQIEKIK
jgi:hypothetical protein